jgi:hypothetical protein
MKMASEDSPLPGSRDEILPEKCDFLPSRCVRWELWDQRSSSIGVSDVQQQSKRCPVPVDQVALVLTGLRRPEGHTRNRLAKAAVMLS